jgi:transposase-like protein
MVDKEKEKCLECGSKNVVRKGKSKTKFSVKQIYKCEDCGKRFVSDLRNKSYPIKIIMNSIVTYNLGNNLAETSKIIKKRFKIEVPEKTVYSWVKEFDKICSYYRTRDKAVKLFKPKDTVFIKIFRHLQLYKYRYHKAKVEFFVRNKERYLATLNTSNLPTSVSQHDCPTPTR